MIHLPLLLMAAATASDSRDIVEKTFTRDNTFCKFGENKVQFQIRSYNKFTEMKEKAYGEFVFFYPEEEKAELLPLNKDGMHTFRIFHGKSDLCSKSHGYLIGKDKIAVLFLMENRPFKDKLSFQLINRAGNQAIDSIHTNYIVDDATIYSDGFIFKNHSEKLDLDMGTFKKDGLDYTYQDREFISWVSYTSKGFQVHPLISYQKSHWKTYYQNEKDYMENVGWDETTKQFKNQHIYFAVNHKQKKECVLHAPTKVKPTGTELGWRCR